MDAPRSPLRSLGRLFTNDEQGWFAQVGGLGEGNGLAVGGGHRIATSDGVLTARLMVSNRQSYLASADWRRELDAAGRWSLSLGLSDRRDAQQLFSGTGAQPDATPTGYALTTTTADVRAGWHPAPWLTTTFGVAAVKPTVTGSTDDRTMPLLTRYSPREAAGVTTQPTFAVVHAGVAIDTRRAPGAVTGGQYAFEWRHYDDRADLGYAFDLVRIELAHQIALGTPSRLVSVRALAQQATPSTSGRVPFYFQPTLGGGRSLRGYDRQRFRDQSAVLVQAEFQQRLHKYVAAAAFLDAGQVAPRLGALRADGLLTTYGVGVRLGKAGGPGLRTDLAFGGERPVCFVVGFSTGF